MSNDRDDLAALLEDLRVTLDELERTLDTDDDRGDGGRGHGRRSPSRGPRGSDVVRFTEEYTIPTVIAILETTIQSLELLRGVLRLADPGRSLQSDERGLDGVDRRVVEGTERALDDLRRALTGTEEPTDPVARDVFREARDLTAEIESRLTEARGDVRRDTRRGGEERQSVVIPVDDETGPDETDAGEAESDEDDSEVDVDVDAELASIREEVREESAAADATDGVESDDASDADRPTDESGDGDEAR